MAQQHNINIHEENELQKIFELVSRNYYLFIIGVVSALMIAFVINKYLTPKFKITSTLLIKENPQQQNMSNVLSSSLFGSNKNLQDELLSVQSSSVIAQTIKNLDLPVSYYRKKGFQYRDAYKNVPFRVMYAHNHAQPINARFEINFGSGISFTLKAKGEKVSFYHFEENTIISQKKDWTFNHQGKLGKLIETPELSFII